MATIDNLDISIYNLYAIRTKMIEETNKELRLKEATSVSTHLQVLDTYPKLTELDILLGVGRVKQAFASFPVPKNFHNIRRSPFAFSRVAPSLGSLEEHDDILAALSQVQCHTQDEKREKGMIQRCLDEVENLNSQLGFIIGRVGQFLQG